MNLVLRRLSVHPDAGVLTAPTWIDRVGTFVRRLFAAPVSPAPIFRSELEMLAWLKTQGLVLTTTLNGERAHFWVPKGDGVFAKGRGLNGERQGLDMLVEALDRCQDLVAARAAGLYSLQSDAPSDDPKPQSFRSWKSRLSIFQQEAAAARLETATLKLDPVSVDDAEIIFGDLGTACHASLFGDGPCTFFAVRYLDKPIRILRYKDLQRCVVYRFHFEGWAANIENPGYYYILKHAAVLRARFVPLVSLV